MGVATIGYEVQDGVATITLDRPHRLNAFTLEMAQELIRALDLADADDHVRAVILTGSGRAFSSGADLSAGGGTFEPSSDGGPHRDTGGEVTLRIFASLKPVIAAVNGPAVGLGASICLPADFVLASSSARFGFPFARLGITPDGCSTWFLPRRVGISTAAEWLYTGRTVSADEALSSGLVRSVHAPDTLSSAARELASSIAGSAAPCSVAAIRQMIWRMLGAPHPVLANHAESIALAASGRSADAREGVAAFVEKRSPEFVGSVSSSTALDVFGAFPAPAYPG
jgi:enoyl-CoA hydratase/carnithine racemase